MDTLCYQVLLPDAPAVFGLTLLDAQALLAENPGARLFEFSDPAATGVEITDVLEASAS